MTFHYMFSFANITRHVVQFLIVVLSVHSLIKFISKVTRAIQSVIITTCKHCLASCMDK